MSLPAILDNGRLRATLTPGLGGTVVSLRHLPSGAELLAQAPWPARAEPLPEGHAPDEATWLTRFSGGWPVMFPNAGDACTDGGVRHGFHGEGSMAPWEARREGDVLTLSRRFIAVPAIMIRRFRLAGNRLELEEEVRAEGAFAALWGQHVTLGGDLLAGPLRLESSARRLRACPVYDSPANPLRRGAEGAWPLLPGKAGPVDLSRPAEGVAALACLAELGPAPWAELSRADGRLAARLDWSADPWPLAWLWLETGGTLAPPWEGRARMIGIEPCSSWPATGLAAVRAAGGALPAFRPGEVRRARLTLTVLAA